MKYLEERIVKLLMLGSIGIVGFFVLSVLWTIFKRGFPVLSWEMVSQLPSGGFYLGGKIRVLPSGTESTVKSIDFVEEHLEEAYAPMSVTLTLNDDIDISRGDTLVKADEKQPSIEQDITLDVCWFNERPAAVRNKYVIRQATFETQGLIRSINYRRNINTLEKEEGVSELKMNDIAEITIHTANPLVFDKYTENKVTGSLIFIDPDTNETVGAGLIK
jgi:sulfate adenylyltransferase subunit 1